MSLYFCISAEAWSHRLAKKKVIARLAAVVFCLWLGDISCRRCSTKTILFTALVANRLQQFPIVCLEDANLSVANQLLSGSEIRKGAVQIINGHHSP